MGFKIPPSQRISGILQRLAFSGNSGLSLEELWDEGDDDFTKGILWKMIVKDIRGKVWYDNKQIEVVNDYQQFLDQQINVKKVRLYPSVESQWEHLTGKKWENAKKIKSQLGEYPYKLLIEIGKHGSKGIYTSDLSKATNQDPRSLTLRIKKLQDFKFINKINTYNKESKLHTSLCVHSKFVNEQIEFENLNFDDDLGVMRNPENLKSTLMKKLNVAPDQLRALPDLKLELGLDKKNKSLSKFFNGTIEYLCQNGYVERVMLKSLEEDRLVSCIKLIKGLSQQDNTNFYDELKFSYDESFQYPIYNQVFPLANQVRSLIKNKSGITSMEVSSLISGPSDNKQLMRLVETLTTYLKDHDKLTQVKKYKDPYPLAITRTYDFDGKFKFYRYYADDGIIETTDTSDELKPVRSLLMALNKPTSIGKFNSTLFGGKRKADDTPRPSKRAKKETSIKPETPLEPASAKASASSTSSRKKVSSIKSVKRREALISIIKEQGGATFTSAQLCRDIDSRLGHSTNTDMKTLRRDIPFLEDIIEAREIKTTRTGQSITRIILILKDPRPSDEKIQEVTDLSEADEKRTTVGVPINERRVIDANVVIYNKPKRRLDTLEKKPRKVRVKKEVQDHEPLEQPDEPKDIFTSLISRRFKGSKKPKKTGPSNHVSLGRKRTVAFSQDDVVRLFKLIVISRTFEKSIDFEALLKYFPGIKDGKELKQKWTLTRKKIGGSIIVTTAMKKFENLVLSLVDEGVLEPSHLNPIDFDLFLAHWNETSLQSLSKSLFHDAADNYANYDVIVDDDNELLLYDLLLNNSMRQKELILASKVFFQDAQVQQQEENHEADKVKTILRAVCLTSPENFQPTVVKQVLADVDDETAKKVAVNMVSNKELAYNGVEDTDRSFFLTDRFNNLLISKQTVSNIQEASRFNNVLGEFLDFNKAIILSQGINTSHMISIVDLMSKYNVDIIHLDKHYEFSGYESRLIEKSKLDCDLVLKRTDSNTRELKKVKIPTGKACSHVWLDLNGNILVDTWLRITGSLVWFILYRPGVQLNNLFKRFKDVVTIGDLKVVLEWLKETGSIEERKFSDYWVCNNWFDILGD